MEGIDVQAIVRQAIQEYASNEQAKSEPAYKAELEDERKRREQLERRLNELVAENKRKVQVGTLTDLDVAQSLSQLASSQAALLAAQQLVSQDENNLKALITDRYRDLYDVQLVPAEKLLAVPEMFDLEGSWQIAMTRRPDLLQARTSVERLDVNRRFQISSRIVAQIKDQFMVSRRNKLPKRAPEQIG